MKMTNELSSDNKSTRKQRHIIKRMIVRGILILDTPTCLGSGDADSPTDLPLLRDSISDRALLTGASIAGALRNYLREREHGYLTDEKSDDLATALFGGTRKDEDGDQSPLIIDDAISSKIPNVELRDGVEIDSATGTAKPGNKYDLELLAAGTEFPLSFELLLEQKKDSTEQQSYENKLVKSLALALQGLEQGEISLGMKKRRGFGRCHVKEWQVWNFNLEDANDRILWLNFEHWRTGFIPIFNVYASIKEGLIQAGLHVTEDSEDKRDRFAINATFTLASSLLIRSGQAETGRAPDVVHLKSHRPKKKSENEPDPSQQNLVPILSGTSLAGILRHRAERIVKTLQCSSGQNPECDKEPEIIKSIFGHVENKRSQASRLIVHESTINHTTDLVQTRIAIDRFTGGAYHGALFQEQPIFGKGDENLKLEIELRNATQNQDYEIGLLLLLLKDLWTQDLPVGGTSSIGRGRLQGKQATLTLYRSQNQETWTITQVGEDKLQISDPDRLETFVKALVDFCKKEVNDNA